jgi:hypothetical protein
VKKVEVTSHHNQQNEMKQAKDVYDLIHRHNFVKAVRAAQGFITERREARWLFEG